MCYINVLDSSVANQAALESQRQGLNEYAMAKGYQIIHVVCEFGSEVSDNYKKFHVLIKKRDFDRLLVEHKDRLT
ncbi:hypothetical protein CCP3SC5AM1_780004 [Gammaproteobacteria bacterium]